MANPHIATNDLNAFSAVKSPVIGGETNLSIELNPANLFGKARQQPNYAHWLVRNELKCQYLRGFDWSVLMRWLTILAAVPVSISAQAWTANDLDATLQAGKSSPRFAEVVNLYANFTLDQARETQIANIRSQLDKLRATLRAMQVRQGEIEQAISTRKIELTPDQIAQRQAEGFAELQDIAKRLDYLTRITKWIQSGGTVEPGLSMEELESSPPPMQSMEELRGLLVQARGVQARLTDPTGLREQELANYLLALREEQATLKAKVQPVTGAVALLEAKLQQISAQPVLLSNADRELISARTKKLRAMIEQ